MKLLIIVILLLIEERTSQETPADVPVHSVKIGDSCKRDVDCIENAYCRVQLECMCEPFFTPGPTGTKCHATSGKYCKTDIDCETMSNAECIQGACSCKDDFISDINNSSNCITRPTREGDRCQRSDDCIEALGRSLCINEQCKCISDFRFINGTKQCVEMRGIYQPCKINDECYDVLRPDSLYCNDQNECAYTDKYNDGISLSIATSTLIAGLSMAFYNYFYNCLH